MATETPGGEIGGYWAIGRNSSEMPPVSVMRMDSTAAKIGRSMKKREIICAEPVGYDSAVPLRHRGACPRGTMIDSQKETSTTASPRGLSPWDDESTGAQSWSHGDKPRGDPEKLI